MAEITKTDKYEEDLQKLIEAGKEKGFLTYNEVNEMLPGDVTSPDDLDDLLTTIGTQGIDILESNPKYTPDKGGSGFDDAEPGSPGDDDVELDLTPGQL